jgi:hypothetical protein
MTRPSPDEFVPLPYFGWDSRPETLLLDVDECATALYLANGNVKRAADLLKVTERQLQKLVRKHHKLQRVIERMKEPG